MSKLVRDRIPEIILGTGKVPVVTVAAGDEYRAALLEKLIEEAREVRAAASEPGSVVAKLGILQELADVLEVIDAIRAEWGIAMAVVVMAQDVKRQKRGAFAEYFILHESDG